MKYTKQLFMILLIVFLLVGLGTLTATDINKTNAHKSTEVSKTSTTSKEAKNINKVPTTKNAENKTTETRKDITTTKEKYKTINKRIQEKTTKNDPLIKDITTYDDFNTTLSSSESEDVTLNILPDNMMLGGTTEINNNIKKLTINGVNSTINGTNQHQFLHINKGQTVIINNLIITNCHSSNIGGAIYVDTNSKLIVNNTKFIYNTAVRGGAIGGDTDSTITLIQSNLSNNTVTDSWEKDVGGAIYANTNSNITINYSNLTSNTATKGGAIYANTNSNLTINYSNLTNNTATGSWRVEGGGAIYGDTNIIITINNTNLTGNNAKNFGGAICANTQGNITLYNSNLTDNKANSFGGVICGYTYSNITINNSNLTDNTASRGGVISGNNNNSITINNSNLIHNTVNDYGGGIYEFENNTITINNSNLTHSTAGMGGTMYLSRNNLITIIQSNLTGNNATNFGGAISSGDSDYITIIQSNLNNNNVSVMYGGAIYAKGSTITINNTNLTCNTANQRGGAIHTIGILTIIQSNLNNNTATSLGYGGAISVEGTLNITNSNLTNNKVTYYGGAISTHGWDSTTIIINNTNLTYNTADTRGGAIEVSQSKNADDEIIFINSNFIGNQAPNGAAIYYSLGYRRINITNNTFINNTATSDKETLDLSINSEKTLKNNIYDNTDIKLKTINLTTLDEKLSNLYKENIILKYNIVLEHPQSYDEDILSKINKTLYINSTEYNTTKNNNYTLSNLKPGKYTAYYTTCNTQSNNITLTIEYRDSEINADKKIYDHIYATNDNITLIIEDSSGEKGNINITVKDEEGYKKLFNYSNVENGYQLSTESLVKALENIYTTLNSSYLINVTYYNDYVNPSSTNFTLNLIKRNTTITYTILNNTAGNVTIAGTVKDKINGSNVNEGTIIIKNGQTIIGNTTVKNGQYTIPTNIANKGTYTLTVEYPETKQYQSNKKNMGTITVNPRISQITAKAEGNITGNINITATLKDITTQKAIANAPITITLPNGTIIPTTTDSNGVARTPVNLPVGKQNIKITYPGNQTYQTSNTTIDVSVDKIPTTTAGRVLNNTAGNVAITGTVKDNTGKNVPAGIVTIRNANSEVGRATIANGVFTSTTTINTAGKYSLNIQYVGTDTYQTSSTTIDVSVDKIPTTTAGRVLNNTVGNVVITGTVKDNTGKNVPAGIVTIRNVNTEVGRAIITNGVFTSTTTINTAGKYSLNIQYVGTNTYQTSNTTLTITVNPRSTQITGKAEGTIADTTNITATLKDTTTGKAISNAPITVTLPNKTQISANTDNNGNIKVPVDLPKGNNKITINYPGNNTYKSSSTTIDVPVTGKTPSMQVTPQGNKIGNSNITVTLKDPITGKLINNAPITVTLPNGTQITSTTGPAGSTKISLDLKNTNNNITVTYNGNGTYNPVSTKQNITLSKNTPIIKLNPVRGIIGENITLTAYLNDTDGTPITGGNLAFKLNGKTLRSDGRFDSKAPAMKFKVENGLVTFTIKADLYLRNAKNLTAAYSGNYKYQEMNSPSVQAQIQKRYANITVTVTPKSTRQYDNITIKVTAKDTTKNGKNTTLITDNTRVMLKINGVTLKDNNGKTLYLAIQKDATATYIYNIPSDMGGITSTGKARNYPITAIFTGDNYYPGAKNTTTFQVQRSTTYVNITQARVTKTNVLSVKATLKDYKGNYLKGTNKVTIKINGKNYIDPKNGKAKYWSVKNGVVNLTGITVDPKTTIKRVMLVTGERQAYTEGRAETTNIIRT